MEATKIHADALIYIVVAAHMATRRACESCWGGFRESEEKEGEGGRGSSENRCFCRGRASSFKYFDTAIPRFSKIFTIPTWWFPKVCPEYSHVTNARFDSFHFSRLLFECRMCQTFFYDSNNYPLVALRKGNFNSFKNLYWILFSNWETNRDVSSSEAKKISLQETMHQRLQF